MATSEITRNYWIEKAKGWAEAKLSPPQADEFISAMDEVRAENERLRAALAWYADPENYLTGFDKPGQIVWNVMYEGGERARKALEGGG